MLSVMASVTLDKIGNIKKDIQGKLDTLSNSLNIKVGNIKLEDITTNRKEIQETLNKISSKVQVKVDSVKITSKGISELKKQLQEQKLTIDVEPKSKGSITTQDQDVEDVEKITKATKQMNDEIAKVDVNKYRQLNDILRDIEQQYGKVTKVSKTINSQGFETGKIITYKNSIGQVIQEFYQLQKMEDGTYDIANGLQLMNTKVIQSAEQLEKVQSKINSLKSDAQSLINSFSGNGLLKDSFVQNLQKQLDGINTNKGTKEIQEFVSELKKLKTSENQIITLTKYFNKLEQAINEVQGSKSVDLMDNSQVVALAQAQSAMKSLEQTMTELQNGSIKTSTEIRNLTTNSKVAGDTLVQEFSQATTTVTGLGSSFRNIASYIVGGSGILLAIQTVKNAFQDLKDIDKALIDISRVVDDSFDLTGYSQQANSMARELNQTTEEILKTSYEVQKLGYDLGETGSQLAEMAGVFANVGDITVDESLGNLVTILKGYNIETEDTVAQSQRVIDVFNELGNTYAISAGNIGNAFKSSASNLAMTGTTIEEASALITASYEVLQDDTRVGNGLKTISLRVQGYADKLSKLGVEAYTSTGRIRSLYDIMLDASNIYNELKLAGNDKQAYNLLETLGGKQQASVVASIIQNIETMQKAYETAQNSAGSAGKEQERIMNSLDAIINSLKQNLVGLWQDLGDSEAIKNLVRSLDDMITSLRNNDELISTLGNGISGTLNLLTGFINKFGLLETAIVSFVGYMSLTNEKFKAFGQNLSNSIPIIKKIPKAFNNAQVSLKNWSNSASENVKSQQALVNSTKLGTTAYASANAKLLVYKGSLVASKVATTALTIATELFNSALTMGITFLITQGISALTSWINKTEELVEANKEYSDSMSSMGEAFSGDDYKNINKLVDNYKQLRQELTSVAEGSEEYNSKQEELKGIEEKMLEILPQLKDCYMNETEAKGLDIEATEKLIGKELELAKAKAHQVLDDNKVKDTGDLKSQIAELKAVEGQIKTVNKLKEQGKKTGITIVDKEWNGTGELSTVTRDLEDYIEKQDRLSSSLQATYDAYSVLDGGTGAYGEELRMLSEALGLVNDTTLGVTESSNSVDTTNIVDQLEVVEYSAEEVTDALKEMYDVFDELTGNLDLLEEIIAQLQQTNTIEEGLYKDILSSGNSALIDILYDQNTALEKAMNLQQEYQEAQANSAKELIDYAHQQEQAKRGVIQAEQDLATTIANTQATEMQSKEKFIDQDVQLRQQELQNFIDTTNAKIGLNDDLCSLMYEQLAEYVNNGGQLYAIDTQNFGNSLGNKERNNVSWVNSVMKQVADSILSNAENYSTDTVNWAKALTSKDGANADAFSNITKNVALALANMGNNYQSDYDSFYQFTTAKASLYNNFAGQIRSNIASMSNMFDGLGKKSEKATDTILTGTKAQLDAMMEANRKASGVTIGSSFTPSKGSFSGTSLSGGNYVGSGSGNNYVGSHSGSSGGSGSGGKGSSASAEKTQADMESLVEIYAELEKAIGRTTNKIQLYESLQKSATGGEVVKYLDLQVGLYKQLRNEQEALLKRQQQRANELKGILSANGFNISNEGMIANYEAQLQALTNTANAIQDADTKKARQDEIKELSDLIKEYNGLIESELGATEKEIQEINNTIRELNKTRIEMVSEAEAQIYDILEHSANKQVELQKKALEEVQDARNKMRDEDDYAKEREEKVSNLADIEAQMEILSRDSSVQGQRKLEELKTQYEELMKEMNETIQNRQDELFDTMISDEVDSLDKQLEEYLDPENINKVIAEAMNTGMANVLGTMYSLNDLSAGFYADTEIGLVNTINLTNEWVDSLEKAKHLFTTVSDNYSALGMNTNLYQQGHDFSNSQSSNQPLNISYTLQFPSDVSTLDREAVERIVQPMLEYSEKATIEAITGALTK